LTNSQSQPPVREERRNSVRRRLNALCSIHRSSRFWPVVSVLALVVIVAGPFWYKSQKRLTFVLQSTSKESIVPASISPPPFREIIGSFQPNQTITQALSQHGLSGSMINQIIDSARPMYNLARVKSSQLYWLCMSQEGKFRNFRYILDAKRYLTVYNDETNNRLVSIVKDFQFETRVESVSADIDSSLFASVERIGEKDQLALDIAEIFGSDIDFNSDIQKGDSFQVLVGKKYLNGQFSGYDAIQAASFSNGRKTLMGFRFADENGKPAYYGPDGKALKKSFLKSPLKFSRITSRFSYKRLHPITRIVQPHLGVDYSAPIGAPVHAVGSGIVTDAGWNGGSGRMVKMRHSGGFETLYLHLSRIAVKRGARLGQGDVIGYVGSTGLSTGPHLDFRVYRYGKAINPLKVVFPPGAPISKDRFDQFASVRDSLINKITNDEARNRYTN
jgi:murein DD-endopeptidase MepM/ murein hydrolase activator NlpD